MPNAETAECDPTKESTESRADRNRRLTLAGQELCPTDAKVIDVAVKYGHDSPDSFARAFTRFHGINPSASKERCCKLNSFAPLKIKLTLEGGSMLEYRIVETINNSLYSHLISNSLIVRFAYRR